MSDENDLKTHTVELTVKINGIEFKSRGKFRTCDEVPGSEHVENVTTKLLDQFQIDYKGY